MEEWHILYFINHTKTLGSVQAGRLDPKGIITHWVPLAEVAEACHIFHVPKITLITLVNASVIALLRWRSRRT